MSGFKSDFLRVLSERGFIHQVSDAEALDALFAKETVTGYIGFDATAKSLHAGSLIQIMMLHWMQKTGHRPVALMGGGTSMIGDPSFKDEARKLLTPLDIEDNLAGIKRSFASYLSFGEGPRDALMVNNADWLMDINYVNFLRDVGRHFSVNRMLSFDSVKLRLDREQSLSFLEFNYMILQAYDFVELNRRHGVRLQMGGSDQWGNIVNGIDLGHRMGTPQLYAITSPLLTTSSGAKMGKTASGAIWLDREMLSDFDFWQYWRKVEDDDVERFLKLYTTVSLDEIADLSSRKGSELNNAKERLADEVTAMARGREAADKAREAAKDLFERGKTTSALPTTTILREMGTATIDLGSDSQWKYGRSNTAIAVASGVVSSHSDARRYMKVGQLRINDEVVTDPNEIVPWTALYEDTGAFKVQLGNKKVVLVKPIDAEVRWIDKGPNGQWSYGRSNAAIAVAAGFASNMENARSLIARGELTINGEIVRDPVGICPWKQTDKMTGAFVVQLGSNPPVLVKPKS